MRKLLIVTDTFLPRVDGVSIVLERIIPKLVKYYDVTVLAPSFDEYFHESNFLGAKLIRFSMSKLTLMNHPLVKLTNLAKVKEYVKKTDIVWIQFVAPLSLAAVYYAHRYNKSVVAYTHLIEWDLMKKNIQWIFKPFKIVIETLVKFTYRSCDLIIVPSVQVLQIFDAARINTRKVIIPLATDPAEFYPPRNKIEAKIKAGFDQDKIVIGYCGRISREKDLITLLKSYRELKRKNDNISLLIVGDGDEKIKVKLKLERDVKITGFVRNVVPYMQAIDIYVNPSFTETTSLSTLEAMSTGLAVLSTPVGVLKETIVNGVNGYRFSRGDFHVLRILIEKLIEDEKLRRQLGHNARRTILKEFSWDETIRKLVTVFNTIH